MTQALPKPITFEDFLEWKPETGRYELRDGVILEMQPTGEHEEITGFLVIKLAMQFERLNLPYFISLHCCLKLWIVGSNPNSIRSLCQINFVPFLNIQLLQQLFRKYCP